MSPIQRQLTIFLIFCSFALVMAEYLTRRSAGKRYLILGAIWLLLVSMLFWTVQE
jgi:hypothetical protein